MVSSLISQIRIVLVISQVHINLKLINEIQNKQILLRKMGKKKNLILLTTFYIYQESGIKSFLKWSINKCLRIFIKITHKISVVLNFFFINKIFKDSGPQINLIKDHWEGEFLGQILIVWFVLVISQVRINLKLINEIQNKQILFRKMIVGDGRWARVEPANQAKGFSSPGPQKK